MAKACLTFQLSRSASCLAPARRVHSHSNSSGTLLSTQSNNRMSRRSCVPYDARCNDIVIACHIVLRKHAGACFDLVMNQKDRNSIAGVPGNARGSSFPCKDALSRAPKASCLSGPAKANECFSMAGCSDTLRRSSPFRPNSAGKADIRRRSDSQSRAATCSGIENGRSAGYK